MEQKDKELLLKDLCARIPYVLIIRIEERDWNDLHIDAYDTPFRIYYLEPFILEEIKFKPYLRPMSSMTKEELKEYCKVSNSEEAGMWTDLDWLNAHHFDYRGLIEKGLALEAPEGMY